MVKVDLKPTRDDRDLARTTPRCPRSLLEMPSQVTTTLHNSASIQCPPSNTSHHTSKVSGVYSGSWANRPILQKGFCSFRASAVKPLPQDALRSRHYGFLWLSRNTINTAAALLQPSTFALEVGRTTTREGAFLRLG